MHTPVLLVVGVAMLAGCNKQAPVQAKQDTGPVKVRTAQVVTRELQRDVESVGSLFPYEEVVISSEIDGRVEAVSADLGDRVSTGQVLVRVSDEEQKYLVAQNEAQLRQALERLGLKDAKDRVKDIRETPEVRRAQAELFDAEQRYKRVRELVDQQIASRQDLDQALARFQSLQAAYDTTLNQTRNLIQDVERTKAILDLQRKKLRDTSIRAPFPAQVKERLVNVGQFVRSNTPVFSLVKTDPIRLRIEAPERMSPWIKVGQVADVSLEAYPERKFQGKIWRISPTVEQTKRTFIVEALIANGQNELKPGSYAKARIHTDKVDRIKLVPRRSVNYVFGSNKAYIVKNGVIETRDVKIGDTFGEQIEIIEGLEEGQVVATTQLARLDNGSKVVVEKVVAE
ncbi:MAG TPA: efflux RND transporter periplasmic adaptor subunit [Bryobacteraceae bacterium]|nr:efflux RND transporter periplasmic adaptor subunit [Bryobacteraceae bacterium]